MINYHNPAQLFIICFILLIPPSLLLIAIWDVDIPEKRMWAAMTCLAIMTFTILVAIASLVRMIITLA